MRQTRIAVAAAALAVGLLAPTTASAATSLFLQLESYATTTKDAQMRGSAGTFGILSWNWSAKRVGEQPTFGELTITKWMDKNSPLFAQDVATGRQLSRAVLTGRTQGARPGTFLRFCFTDVTVSSYKVSGSASGEGPTEEVGIQYGSYAMSFRDIDPATGRAVAEVIKGWNVIAGTTATVPALASC